jgi:hypothetical protein
MTSDRSREAAYADLVAGLLDLRTDPATERFDAELAAAEEEGRIDAQTAKVLRWWQRESLRTMVEHASSVVPPTMMALERAATGSEHEVQASARSWARAGSQPGPAGPAGPAGPVGPAAPAAPAPASLADVSHRDEADDLDEPVVPPPTDLSEHRRRLLVAGLTRVRQ